MYPEESSLRWVNVIPLFTMVAALIECYFIVGLLDAFPDGDVIANTAHRASFITTTKWLLTYSANAAVGFSVLKRIFNKFCGPKVDKTS